MSDSDAFAQLYDRVLEEIEQRAQINETFLDTDAYRILLATVWASALLDPARAGIPEQDLEHFFGYLETRAEPVLGGHSPLLESCRYLLSRDGRLAMERLRVPAGHRQQLERIAGLMVDPHGLRQTLQTDY